MLSPVPFLSLAAALGEVGITRRAREDGTHLTRKRAERKIGEWIT